MDEVKSAIWQTVFAHCAAEHTGTLFIATEDNKSGQLVIHGGQLIGLACAGQYGTQAATAIDNLSSARFSFTPDLIFPVPETLLPLDAEAILNPRGYAAFCEQRAADLADPAGTNPDLDPDTSIAATDTDTDDTQPAPRPAGRIYRGQHLPDPEPREPRVNATKSVRIYRGQIVAS